MSAPKRKDYLKNFEKQGKEYVYKGKHYIFDGTEEERKKQYLYLYVILEALYITVFGSGFLTGGGMKNSYFVILPFILEACTLFVAGWQTFKLLTKRGRIRDYVFLSAKPKIPVAYLITAFFAAAGFICSLVYIIINGFEGGAAQCIIYLALKLVCIALSMLFRNLFSKLNWIEE